MARVFTSRVTRFESCFSSRCRLLIWRRCCAMLAEIFSRTPLRFSRWATSWPCCSFCLASMVATASALFTGFRGDRLFALQIVFDFSEQLAARPSDDGQIMQIACHLVRIVAIEQESKRVGAAQQVLAINQFFQLCLLAVQVAFQFAGLNAKSIQRVLLFHPLGGQLMQRAERSRDFLLDALELIRGIRTLNFGGGHAFAQRSDLSA